MLFRVCASLIVFFVLSSTLYAETKAGDFKLQSLNGEISLSKYKGKVVYLDFWASWCVPCRKSFPWMNEMQKKYGKQGLQIIAVNLDTTREAADAFLKKYPAQFTIAFDPKGSTADQYEVKGMPSAYLISKSKSIADTHLSFRDKDKAKLKEKISGLLIGFEKFK